jgi:hypothetical protein
MCWQSHYFPQWTNSNYYFCRGGVAALVYKFIFAVETSDSEAAKPAKEAVGSGDEADA